MTAITAILTVMVKIYTREECYTSPQIIRRVWGDSYKGTSARGMIRRRLHFFRTQKGLPYIMLSTKTILYPRDLVDKWLQERQHNMV